MALFLGIDRMGCAYDRSSGWTSHGEKRYFGLQLFLFCGSSPYLAECVAAKAKCYYGELKSDTCRIRTCALNEE